jgi:hypothetical protein
MTPSGRRFRSSVVKTNARCLIEAVRQLPSLRHICLEEGTLSEWLCDVAALVPVAVLGALAVLAIPRTASPVPASSVCG